MRKLILDVALTKVISYSHIANLSKSFVWIILFLHFVQERKPFHRKGKVGSYIPNANDVIKMQEVFPSKFPLKILCPKRTLVPCPPLTEGTNILDFIRACSVIVNPHGLEQDWINSITSRI